MHGVSARDASGITCSVVVTWGSGKLELQHWGCSEAYQAFPVSWCSLCSAWGSRAAAAEFSKQLLPLHLTWKRREIFITHWICLLWAEGAFTIPFHTTDNFS